MIKNIFLILCLSLSFYSKARTVKIKSQSDLRPDVKVKLPRTFKNRDKWPLIISLHGYGGNSLIQQQYVRLGLFENKVGYVFAVPNGIKNKEGKRFWNASRFCCNFDPQEVDDVAYIKT